MTIEKDKIRLEINELASNFYSDNSPDKFTY